MTDPLAEVVSLLQPRAPFSKVVRAAGPWRIRRTQNGQPFYCVILEGSCRLEVGTAAPVTMEKGDFVLIPAVYSSIMTSTAPPPPEDLTSSPLALPNGEFRLGAETDTPNVQLLVGHCVFGSPDAALLVSLLPQVVHIRGEKRLATLVQLVGEESRAQRPAREVILERLLEVLFIEALRSTAGTDASAGLVRGLADPRLASSIRQMHANPARSWTVADLAKEAALSRSAFFERFNRAVGVTPMDYLLAWRMAMAKAMLSNHESTIAEIAERVGYSSASTFSVAFSRYVGRPPAQHARDSAHRS